MATKEIEQYFDATVNRDARDDLKLAVSLLPKDEREENVAVDCGCGAGPDIVFLREHGFNVHAYDIEEEAISRCKQRFQDDAQVHVSQASFNTFTYPSACLVYADASLFYCPKSDFDEVIAKIKACLVDGGFFAGSFLGHRDTMASPEYDGEVLWSNVLTTDEVELKEKFSDYEIVKFTEHELDGSTALGVPHHWHIFSMVVRKMKVRKMKA